MKEINKERGALKKGEREQNKTKRDCMAFWANNGFGLGGRMEGREVLWG